MSNSATLNSAQISMVGRYAQAGQYPEMYGYLAEQIRISGGDPRLINWLEVAAAINGNDGSFVSDFVRGYTIEAGKNSGQIISYERFQEVSNALAHDVYIRVINGGNLDVDAVIGLDVERAVRDFNLPPEGWAGTAGAWLPTSIGGLGLDLNSKFYQDLNKSYQEHDNISLDNLNRLVNVMDDNINGVEEHVSHSIRSVVNTIKNTVVGIVDWWGRKNIKDIIDDVAKGNSEKIINEIRDSVKRASITRSPLILDLNTDGIQTISVEYGINFDHDNNNFAEQSGWINAQDGFLVFDKDGSNSIDNGAELFGNNTLLSNGQLAANGFLALADWDTNHDSVVDALDIDFNQLQIWRDLDSSASSSSNELFSLTQLGIQSLSVNYVAQGYVDVNQNYIENGSNAIDASGNEHRQTGTFTRTDGTIGRMDDVWFQVDTANSVDKVIIEISDEISLLPEVDGFGNVHSLQQSMQLDTSKQLQNLFLQFAVEDDINSRQQLITQILYHWAGVQNVDPLSRASTSGYGNVIGDARKLETLEAFSGEEYLGTWCWGTRDPNPHGVAAPILLKAFDDLSEYVYVQLMMQTHFSSLMELVGVTINDGVIGWDVSDLMDQLQSTYAQQTTQSLLFVTDFIICLRKYEDDSSGSILSALHEVALTNNSEFGLYLRNGELSANIGNFLDNYLSGSDDKNDELWGLAGNDRLYAMGGNDTLDGGTGNDYLAGGAGADFYVFNRGDGQDTVMNADIDDLGANLDILKLGLGISTADVNLVRDNFDLIVHLKGTNDQVRIQSYFDEDTLINQGYTLDQITFEGGAIWTSAIVKNLLVQTTQNNDVITGYNSNDVLFGLGGNDSLNGAVGNDTLDGGVGSDTLNGGIGNDYLVGGIDGDILNGDGGGDTLDGGAGNDYLVGGFGADMYIFNLGSGKDQILQGTADWATDILLFGEGIDPSKISVKRNEKDLIFKVNETDQLTIKYWFLSYIYPISKIQFFDGTIWNLDRILEFFPAEVKGTNQADMIMGSWANDVIVGYAGDDTIYGGVGDDAILAGSGNDQVYAGIGDDLIRTGTGNDQIIADEGDDTIEISTGNHSVWGGAGNDTIVGTTDYFLEDFIDEEMNHSMLFGGDGNDDIRDEGGTSTMCGGAGDDVISGNGVFVGGVGDDTLSGIENGVSNTYIFNLGDGKDTIFMPTITDSMPTDNTIKFGAGILPSDVHLLRDNNDMIFKVNDTDQITVKNWFNEYRYIEYIQFENGVQWGVSDLYNFTYTVSGTIDNNWLRGWNNQDILSGLAGNDDINSYLGNDILDGGEGNDSLFAGGGNDTLIGGHGSDILRGDPGSDVYVFSVGSGIDYIEENEREGSSIDVVQFTDVASSDIRLSRSSMDLVLAYGVTDQLVVKNYFYYRDDYYYRGYFEKIEQFKFSDGAIWGNLNWNGTTVTPTILDYGWMNVAPTLVTALTDQSISQRSVLNYVIPEQTFFDGNGDALTYSVAQVNGSSLPDWLHFNAATRTLSTTLGNNVLGTLNLRVTVNDGRGGVVTDDFDLTVDSINRAPIVAKPLVDQVMNYNNVYVIPDDVFSDVEGDALTYDMSWVYFSYFPFTNTFSFNPATRTLKKSTYVTSMSGRYYLRLTASDGRGGRVTDDFYITFNDVNYAPIIINNISTQVAAIGRAFNYELPTDIFQDVDFGDVLSYQIRQVGGAALPSWLKYNAATRTLSGIALSTSTLNLEVVATDLSGETAKTTFTLIAREGSNYNDTIVGTTGADTLVGLAGDDIYTVNNIGDVAIESINEGIDTVNSSVSYILGNNLENLTLTGTAAINANGNTLNNILTGNNGNNILDGGVGSDTMIGGSGNDIFVVDNVLDVVIESLSTGGIDTVQASLSYTLGNNLEKLTLTGTSNINATGNTLANVLTGNSGDNILDGSTGADTMIGGVGNDTYIVDKTSDVVIENVSEGLDIVNSSVTYALSNNIENLVLAASAAINGTGNALNNILTGNSSANILNGGAGNDTINAGAGNDTIDGGVGIDVMLGGMGNDIYTVDNVLDVITEFFDEGIDTINSSVSFALSNNVENLVLTGTAIINGIGNVLNNMLAGNNAANLLSGGDGNDTLNGGAGNDTIDGGIGNDSMLGSVGDDIYIVDSTADVISEAVNAGNDTVQASVTYTLGLNIEKLILTGTTNINATGNTLVNILVGNSADNVLDGGSGSDILQGGLGNDIYIVDNTADVIVENINEGVDSVNSSVTYTIGNNVENLTLTGTTAINGTGNSLDNILQGNAANNSLTGNAGNDTLIGGAGNDTLTGGAGNDVYQFTRGNGIDIIVENDATIGNSDTLYFTNGITNDQLWFKHVGNNLEVSVIGTKDKLIMSNWYVANKYQIENFKTADGNHTLSAANVANLVNAMAMLAIPTATTLSTSYQTTLNPIIAANW